MVTRTVTTNLTSTQVFDKGPGVVGYYYQKIQSGADVTLKVSRKPVYAVHHKRKTRFNPVSHRWEVVLIPSTYRVKLPKLRNPHRFTDEQHPYTMQLREYRSVPLSYRVLPSLIDQTASSRTHLTQFSVVNPPVITPNEITDHVAKFASKVRGSDFNVGVTLGEAHKSLDLIGDSAIRIAKALRSAKRLDIAGVADALGVSPLQKRKARNHGHTATSLWLEYTYGWRPLVTDIYSAAIAVHTITQQPAVRRVAAKPLIKNQAVDRPNNNGPFYDHRVQQVGYKIVGYFSHNPAPSYVLGLTDPLSIAWELVPFSFVADWVLPIGNYLQALNAAINLEGKFVISTWSGITGRGVKSGGNFIVSEAGFSASEKVVTLTREVQGSLLNQVTLPRLIPISEAYSWRKAVSGLALLNNWDTRVTGRPFRN